MTTITIDNKFKWDAHCPIQPIITHMIESEYQFDIIAEGENASIAFCKGNWYVDVKKEGTIVVGDNYDVSLDNENEGSELGVAFIESRLQFHNSLSKEYEIRTVPAQAIYDYLKLRLNLEEKDSIVIRILQPGRNGHIEDHRIKTSRKDW